MPRLVKKYTHSDVVRLEKAMRRAWSAAYGTAEFPHVYVTRLATLSREVEENTGYAAREFPRLDEHAAMLRRIAGSNRAQPKALEAAHHRGRYKLPVGS